MSQTSPRTIDQYISAFSPKVQAILRKIRDTIRRAAPSAQQTISYQIPTFTLNGALVHFAAFKNHIGFYPPVRGDAALVKAVAPYAGAKGNLRFPLDQPIPYDLIARITRHRVKQNLGKPAAKPSGRDVRARVIKLVARLPEATAVSHGTHLSLEVRGKRFGWYLDDHHGDGRLALHCKTSPGKAVALASQAPERFHVPRYIGHHGWIGVWLDLPQPDWRALQDILVEAYCMTAPKSLLAEL